MTPRNTTTIRMPPSTASTTNIMGSTRNSHQNAQLQPHASSSTSRRCYSSDVAASEDISDDQVDRTSDENLDANADADDSGADADNMESQTDSAGATTSASSAAEEEPLLDPEVVATLPEAEQWKHIRKALDRTDLGPEFDLDDVNEDDEFKPEEITPEIQEAIDRTTNYLKNEYFPPNPPGVKPSPFDKIPRQTPPPYELMVPDFRAPDGSLADSDDVFDQHFSGELDDVKEDVGEDPDDALTWAAHYLGDSFRTTPNITEDDEGELVADLPEINLAERNENGEEVPPPPPNEEDFSWPDEKFLIDPFFHIWKSAPPIDNVKSLRQRATAMINAQERSEREHAGKADNITVVADALTEYALAQQAADEGTEDKEPKENAKLSPEEMDKLKREIHESMVEEDVLMGPYYTMDEDERASWINRQMTDQSTSIERKMDIMSRILAHPSTPTDPADRSTFLWKTVFPKDEWEGNIDEKEHMRIHKMTPAAFVTEYVCKQNMQNNPFANFLRTLDSSRPIVMEDIIELLKRVNLFDFMAYNMMLPPRVLESIWEEIQYQFGEQILTQDPQTEMFPFPDRLTNNEDAQYAMDLWVDCMRQVNPEAQQRIVRAKQWKREFIPSTVAFELYAVHKKDREFWTPERLARAFGVPKAYVKAVIILNDEEEAELRGEPVDYDRNLKMFKMERERYARQVFKNNAHRISTLRAYENYVREMSIPAEANESSAYLKSTFTPSEPEADKEKEKPPVVLPDTVQDYPGIQSAKKKVRFRVLFAEVGKHVKANERRFVVREPAGTLRTASSEEQEWIDKRHPYGTKKYK